MNVKKGIQKCTAALSCGLLLASAAMPVFAQEDAASYRKIENVYAKLSADGSCGSAEVVNHFEITTGGTVTDYGAYGQVTNLSTLDGLRQGDGYVRFSAEPGNFYYQGHLDQAELPWEFQIAYWLDGAQVQPQDLGGKSGDLTIRFRCKGKPKASSVFLDNYVMQVSLTLDNDICTGITAPDATIADAGDGTQLTFTVLPGTDADYTVEAKVRDFTMPGFSIAAVPYSISIDTDSFDTGDFSDQMDELTDGADKLRSGAWDLVSGIRELDDGGSSIRNGSSQIKSGLKSLSTNGYELAKSAEGISSALTGISIGLSEGDFSGLSDLAQLPEGLNQMADSLDQLRTSLTGQTKLDPDAEQSVLSGFQAISQGLRDTAAVFSEPEDGKEDAQSISSQLTALIGGISSLASGLDSFYKGLYGYADGINQMASNYSSFHSGLGAFTDGVGELADGAAELADGVGEFADGVSEIPDKIQETIDDMLDEFGGDFEAVSFMDRRNRQISSVQFVLSTEGIELPEVVTAEPVEEELTFWDRLAALFG